MLALVWNNWILIAFLAPLAWAIACLVDVCLIDQQIYRRPSDGLIVSGLFFLLPLALLLPSLLQHTPQMLATTDGASVSLLLQSAIALLHAGGVFSVLAALFYMLHGYFYFRTLFSLNDACNVEIFNLLSVLLVPMIAFFLTSERLSSPYYLAIALASTGIAILSSRHLRVLNFRMARYIGLSVLFVSLSMVLQAKALETLAIETASGIYLLSGLLAAFVLLLLNPCLRGRILPMLVRFGPLFIAVELLATGGLLASQRATGIGPSVSLVAVIECALPMLILLFSYLLLLTSRRLRLGNPSLQNVLLLQTSDTLLKSLALLFITLSIVVIQIETAIV